MRERSEMIRFIIAGLAGMALFAIGEAQATCTYTYQFSSGTTAVASQVNQDLNDIVNCALPATSGTLTSGTLAGTTALPGGGQIASGSISIGGSGWGGEVDSVSNSAPSFTLVNTSQATDDKIWDFETDSGVLNFRAVSDNYGASIDWLQVSRSGTAITAVEFPSVGTTASAPNAFLDASNGNNLLRSTSSVRYKTDIRPLDYAEARKVLKLTPVSFRSISPADDPHRVFLGLTAEQVARYLPQFVNYIKTSDGRSIPDGVQYDRLAAVALLDVVKEQQKQIEALKACRLWCLVKGAFGLRPAP
jgi:hypothetical protein